MDGTFSASKTSIIFFPELRCNLKDVRTHPNTSRLTDSIWNKRDVDVVFFREPVALKREDNNYASLQSDRAAESFHPTDPAWGNLALQVSACEEGPRSYLTHVRKCVLCYCKQLTLSLGVCFYGFIQALYPRRRNRTRFLQRVCEATSPLANHITSHCFTDLSSYP